MELICGSICFRIHFMNSLCFSISFTLSSPFLLIMRTSLFVVLHSLFLRVLQRWQTNWMRSYYESDLRWTHLHTHVFVEFSFFSFIISIFIRLTHFHWISKPLHTPTRCSNSFPILVYLSFMKFYGNTWKIALFELLITFLWISSSVEFWPVVIFRCCTHNILSYSLYLSHLHASLNFLIRQVGEKKYTTTTKIIQSLSTKWTIFNLFIAKIHFDDRKKCRVFF